MNGTWRTPIDVPGTAALNSGKNPGAWVNSVSCGSAGNCAAGGFYTDASGARQAFVASEANGTWHQAIEVAGTGSLNTGATAKNLGASVDSLSCPSAGNCAAGGSYTDASGTMRAFVASEVNGTWHKAIEVPGTAALSTGALNAGATAVSCPSAGNCAAGGFYSGGSGPDQAFVASEANGTWHEAIEVPGTVTLNTGATRYSGASGTMRAFVASEANGTWHKAIEVPGTATLNTGGRKPLAEVTSVSCPPAGNCAAGGFYTGGYGVQQAFVTDER